MAPITDLLRGLRDKRPPLPSVILCAICASALLVFFLLAVEATEAELTRFDRSILLFFRDPADLSQPIGPAWLEQTMIDLTALGGYPLLIVIVSVAMGFLLVSGKPDPAVFVFLSVTAATLANHFLKLVFDRPRPDIVDHLVSTQTASFPSGHATMSAVVYLSLAVLIVRLVKSNLVRAYVIATAILLTFLIGMSRIYLGVHWPSDVIAGWALGVAWASLAWVAMAPAHSEADGLSDGRADP